MSAMKWSNAQLVEALRLVPSDVELARVWWEGEQGAALLAQIANHMAGPVVSSVRRELSVDIDAAEVRSIAWLLLSPERPVLMAHLTSAETNNAWAYLYTSVRNQVLDDVGRFFRRELTEEHVSDLRQVEGDERQSLDEAVQQTARVLQPYTPSALRIGLMPAVM